jgi:acyl carrier protein
MSKLNAREVEQKLIQEIATVLAVDPATVRPDVPLAKLGMDSMSFVEILVFVEKAFGLKLIESGLTRQDFETVRAMAARISEQV